ncbi:MAG TPA: carbamoyl-phosphate synthase large subunit, partial [Clostridiales bacterium UBA8153]|nr:carbamoyl-phosphate synthase large subunit [Clostridiales bacterium UBA8153]
MPLLAGLKKVMVIGSGPIVIGQAAEFDYAGTQACRALREEGLSVILLNSNPATIMTDAGVADRIYLEPLRPEVAAQIIREERPQGLVATLGGQVGLNLAVELARTGVLAEHGVELLGTSVDSIQLAEDRLLFKEAMMRAGQPVPPSATVRRWSEAQAYSRQVGLPLVVRPAFTLGGTGGGLARTPEEFEFIVSRGLRLSPISQVLLEQSVEGWKEIEYEVMRDRAGNAIAICSMENIDAMGIHTGDSIVVAPTLTLTEGENRRLRRAALDIITVLGIAGGCNVQFAVNPRTGEYYVIEVNPRVSRSSALASKATGYPIARITAKIAVGLELTEIPHPITGHSSACFEPAIDYVVVKFPRWPFDKLRGASRSLGTQMKATGEVMAIDRTFEAALHKTVRSAEIGVDGLYLPELSTEDDAALAKLLETADDRRLFVVAELLRRGHPVAELYRATHIDPFFLEGIGRIIAMEHQLAAPGALPGSLREAKELGFSDGRLASLTGLSREGIQGLRWERGIEPAYKMVDSCAAELEAAAPCFYSTYRATEDEGLPGERPKLLVLGSGPIRIGQGIEFDYSSVHAVASLREAGYECIMVNNNPETVSTDFNASDRLYFEPLTAEDVINIIRREKPGGAIVQFGGQTSINLAGEVAKYAGVLGTSVEALDISEDRQKFDTLLKELDIPRPPGGTALSLEEALAIVRRVGYPVLVRPSYVLGGRAMEIVDNDDELDEYMRRAAAISAGHPVLVDSYFPGVEAEVDAIADGEDILVPAIMEHVERAGVHSGDSIAVCPPQGLSAAVQSVIIEYTRRLAIALNVRGLMNVQFVVKAGRVWVLEANLRSSRTVPFLTKVTGVPMVPLAIRVILGEKLSGLGVASGLVPPAGLVAVKVPVFSWSKLTAADTGLGPEMQSTGEVIGVDEDAAGALAKGFLAAGVSLPAEGKILLSVSDPDKAGVVELARALASAGYGLLATRGTARSLEAAGLVVETVGKLDEGSPHVVDAIVSGEVVLVINTKTRGRVPERDGFKIRRSAAEFGVPCLTSLDTAGSFVGAL